MKDKTSKKRQGDVNYSALTRRIYLNQISKQENTDWTNRPYILMTSHPFEAGAIFVALSVLVLFINYEYFDLVVVVFGLIAFYIGIISESFSEGISTLRIKQFTTDNSFSYAYNFPYESTSGLIFDGMGQFEQSFTGWYQAMQFRLGNYRDSSNMAFGCLLIDLPHELPNMLLDSVNNNLFDKRSSLPTALDKDQFLSLEGNFDSYFRLYCPIKYEQQALYIFTPDIMALLIDLGNKYDIEIVGKQLNIYSMNRFDLAGKSTLEGLFNLFSALGPRITKKSTVINTYSHSDTSKFSESTAIKQPVLQRGISVHPAYIFLLFVAVGLFVIWLRNIIKQG